MALNAVLTPFPADLEIWSVRLSDKLNDVFDLVIRGASTSAGVDHRTILGHRVTLSLPEEALLPSLHGIVTRVARGTPEASGLTVYELHVAPAEWVLTKRTNSRIFQRRTVTQIIEEILSEHPVTTKPAAFVRPLPEREYVVQYDETDHDFVHRLLADEGIATYRDPAAGGRWTLVDDTTLQKPPGEEAFTVFANTANLKPGALAVLAWRFESSVEPVAAVRRDFDFERPKLTLEHAAVAQPEMPSPAEMRLEEYAYEPGRLLSAADGQEASRDLEAARALSRVVHLETSFAAGAGTVLHIDGDDLAGDWLVVRSEVLLESVTADGPGRRSAALSAIPLPVRYRPPHRKRPLIFGVQTARVAGETPEGTVDVDEHGRVSLEMRWDRRNLWAPGAKERGRPTRRVRVAQAWAGPGYGLVTLPRVGDEVLVAYEDGNPDRPVVIGRAHNAVNTTPLALPEPHKTQAVWKSQSFGPGGPVEGHNSVLMDDAAGAEMLAFRAQRDMSTVVLRDAATEIAGNEDVNVQGGQSLGVGGGQSTSVGGIASFKAQAILVTAEGAYYLMGNYVTLNSGGTFAIDAVGERTDKSAEKHHFESPAIFLHGRNAVQVLTQRCHIQAESEIVLQSKGSILRITPGAIHITSPGPVEINGAPIKLNC
jgi:type VI secretion system secreted protein VgrG